MLQYNLPQWVRTALLSASTVVTLLAVPAAVSAEPRLAHDPSEQVAHAGAADRSTADFITADPTGAGEMLASCPVDGTATFEDSWGWPRSGGRSHEGVDMVAGRGTAVIAVVDGDVAFKQNRLGGNAVWLTAPNGDKFYYAHLDAFAGESRSVKAGDVIGFVGSTGNAGGAHLHFETHPRGRVENPYPHTLAACVPTPEELASIEAHRANALNAPDLWELFIPTS